MHFGARVEVGQLSIEKSADGKGMGGGVFESDFCGCWMLLAFTDFSRFTFQT